MRQVIACDRCGALIDSHVSLWLHEPCPAWQAEEVRAQLQAREAVARRERWQLRKQVNRLERKIERETQRIATGRGGIMTAKRLLQAVGVMRP